MNIFTNPEFAVQYDDYYSTSSGKTVDEIEKGIISTLLEKTGANNSLLEVGCGTGHWTEFFVEKGYQVTALDSSSAMLSIARKKPIAASFLHADAEKLPFDEESFDIVAAITVLEFVKNQQRVSQEIHRVLKSKGYLLLGCLNKKSAIGKESGEHPVFKDADFLDLTHIEIYFPGFSVIASGKGVYYDTDFTILDYACMLGSVEPAFVGILLQKK